MSSGQKPKRMIGKQGCDLTKMGSRPGSPFGLEDKAPEPPGCLILDLQTLHIPTNKKLEVWTQYRVPLSFLDGYFWGKWGFVKTPEIWEYPRKITSILLKNQTSVPIIQFIFTEYRFPFLRFLTPLLRRPCIHAIFFPTACRTACKHAFCFLRVRPEAVSTRHSWLWQTLDDVYTRRCFSES